MGLLSGVWVFPFFFFFLVCFIDVSLALNTYKLLFNGVGGGGGKGIEIIRIIQSGTPSNLMFRIR